MKQISVSDDGNIVKELHDDDDSVTIIEVVDGKKTVSTVEDSTLLNCDDFNDLQTVWNNDSDGVIIVTCEQCNGTGNYEEPETRFETTIECPFCDGCGEIWRIV